VSDKKNLFANASKAPEQSRVPALKESGALEVVKVKMVYHSARVPEELSHAVKQLALDEKKTSAQALTVEALRLLLASRANGKKK
jgi:hypothetical protein